MRQRVSHGTHFQPGSSRAIGNGLGATLAAQTTSKSGPGLAYLILQHVQVA